MAWEIAAIAVLLSSGATELVRVTVIAVAALVVGMSSFRLAGRHFAGWIVTWVSYRLRRHYDFRDATDPLHGLAGDFRVRQYVDRAGNRFGVAGVDDGWTSVVRLSRDTAPDVEKLLTILRTAHERTDIPLASAQLVIWTVPSTQRRTHLLAVRYRPNEAPLAALARGGGELGALRATASAALGLASALAEAGYHSTVLEAAELAEELRTALGVEPRVQGESRGESRQDPDGWRSWSAGGTTQVCFTPLVDEVRALTSHAPSATFTATSFTLRRTASGKVRAHLAIRVGAQKQPRSRDLDVRSVPLHGHHATYVRRTLPLALA